MKVLMIQEDKSIIEAISLSFNLRWPDAEILCSSEGLSGIGLVKDELPDVVVLDINLSDIDGFEVCKRIRHFSDVPIIILTTRDQEFDKVKGLELGADDYITKPFSHMELLARVKAVIRRSSMQQADDKEETVVVDKLRINLSSRAVKMNEVDIKLTPTEFKLLYLLAKNAGKVISHESLLENIWGADYIDSTDYLKVYIQRLRAKLRGKQNEPNLIVSERGVGYKLAN